MVSEYKRERIGMPQSGDCSAIGGGRKRDSIPEEVCGKEEGRRQAQVLCLPPAL